MTEWFKTTKFNSYLEWLQLISKQTQRFEFLQINQFKA